MIYQDSFQVGGTLDSHHSSYVVRQADRQLLNYLEKNQFCFILNCRQMGKSSLTIRIADRLRNKNFSCAFSDLSILGTSDITPEQWYKSFAYQVLESLDLDDLDLDEWWEKYNSLTAIDCLGKLFKEVILTEVSTNIVIFVDEIDSIIKLPFKDDFFALIRGCYNKRTIDPNYKRLTFCLLGVATPPDLIADKIRTPFNIGHPIDLKGFTVEEARNGLLSGLSTSVRQPKNILAEVIYWTGGQPFLTQKLCQLITEYATDPYPNVEKIVRQHIIEDWESQDHPQHFRTIRDRLLYNPNNTLKVLELYQQILQDKQIIADNSIAQSQLRISGLVVKKDKYLQAYNPIYRSIFNEDWIGERVNNLRPYSLQFNQWLLSNKAENYLLNIDDLDRATQWAKNKNLASEDYEYLSASNKFQDEHKLLLAKQEKEKVTQEKNILIRQRVFIYLTAIASILVVGLGFIVRNREAVISKLNNESNVAVETFEKGEQLKGLAEAIEVNQNLKKKTKSDRSITQYITTEPIEDINNIINQIKEKNKLEITESSITSIANTPDGQKIIVGDENGTVKIWDKRNERVITWKNVPNTATITDLVIDSERQQVYLANKRENIGILVFDLNGNLKNTFKTNNIVSSLAIDPQTNNLIAGDVSGNVTLWSPNGQQIKTRSAHKEQINRIVVNPNNDLIATASNDSTVKLWNNNGELITTLTDKKTGHKNSVNDVAFSPDGKTIATASNDRKIKLWNSNGNFKEDLAGHTDAVNSIAFSSDGRTIISASDDKTIKIWYMGVLKETIIGHQSEIKQIIFDAEDRSFITAANNGTIKVWQTPNVAFNRYQTGLFLNEKKILLVNPQNTQIKSLEDEVTKTISNLKNQFINTIVFNPDNNILFAGTEDGSIAQLNLDRADSWQMWQPQVYPGAIIDLDIEPISNKLITLGIEKLGDNTSYIIREWNQDGQLINSFNYHEEREVTAVKYMPQGNKIAIASRDKTDRDSSIELWDSNGKLEGEIVTNSAKNITSIAFSPDSKLIATSDREGNIRLMAIDFQSDPINHKILATFTKNDGNKIIHLDFINNGKTIRAIDRYGITSDWNLDIDLSIQKGRNWLKD